MIVSAYLAAPVRGLLGDAVDPQAKAENVREGCILGANIRLAFPSLDLYVPHEHEEIIDGLWHNGVSSKSIVQVSCEIVIRRDLLLFYTGRGISCGMDAEYDAAEEAGIPIVEFVQWNDWARERIARVMSDIIALKTSDRKEENV